LRSSTADVRIFIVDTWYPGAVAAHYARTPGLSEDSYETQWRSLMGTFFGTADSYSHYLGELGHVAREYIVNAAPLQEAWACEHGVRRNAFVRLLRRPSAELVLAQAEDFRPDVVYVQNLSVLAPETLCALRAGARLLVGQIASELPPVTQLEPFDVITTSFPHFVDRFPPGVIGEYLRIGFEPRVLEHIERDERYGAVFAGSLGRSQHDHGNEIVAEAAERVEIDFWGRGYDEWPQTSPVRRRFHGEAWGLDMYRVLAAGRISVNRHIDVAENYANNMRLYESTGIGAMLLTDSKRNLGDLFEVGIEAVAYTDADDLAAKIEHFLAHDDERVAIAAAGQRRTLAEHTYADRMRDLLAILARHLD
jgi:spore maturation protein CgeB